MRHCLGLAEQAANRGEYPYAALIARNGVIVAEVTNGVAHQHDVTHHAELTAVRRAQEMLGTTDLTDCTIYSNFEPCAMCGYAIRESRVGKVVFAMRSPLMGGASRWDILGDSRLSGAMPEVFAPPPELMADFLYDEAEASLRRCAPVIWAFMRGRGLLSPPAPQHSIPGEATPAYGRVAQWLMRALRRNFFDRFGRGGGRRQR